MKNTLKLNQNRDFKRLYYRGKTMVSPVLVTYVLKNKGNLNRIGITTSKKIGKAYVRNRSKRVIREAYNQIEDQLPLGYDIVFVARSKTASCKMQEIREIMTRQLERLLTNGKKPD